MSLNIKNAETHRLVKELADATGESMTQAVTEAVRQRLERLKAEASPGKDFDVQEILAMAREIGTRFPPGYFETAFDDLYGDDGLPR